MANCSDHGNFDGLCCPIGTQGAISSYCMLWQEGRLFNSARMAGVNFGQAVAVPAADYCHMGGDLRINCRGTYLIYWQVFVPVARCVSTRLSLQAGGVDLPGAQVSVNHRFGDGDTVYSAQTVVSLLRGAAIRLSSSNLISYSAASPCDVVATLTALKLD